MGLTASGYVQAAVRVPVITPDGVRFSFLFSYAFLQNPTHLRHVALSCKFRCKKKHLPLIAFAVIFNLCSLVLRLCCLEGVHQLNQKNVHSSF